MTQDKAQKRAQRDLGYQPVQKSSSNPTQVLSSTSKIEGGYQPVKTSSSNPTPPKGGSGVPSKPKNNK